MSFGWLCWGLTSQSTIFQSCRDGAIASWVINQYFRGVKCLAQGHNTAAVGLEPRTSRSGVRHSATEPPHSLSKWEFSIYAVIDQRLTSVNWSWLCQKKQFDTLCKQWGELLSSWINWSATDFRQVIQLVNWRLSDIKQPKWCRFFGRRIFFATCFAKWSFFVPKIFFLRIWRQWRPVARTLIYR